MGILLRALAALAVMLVVAVAIWALSHGRVVFLPFFLVLGVPLWWAFHKSERGKH